MIKHAAAPSILINNLTLAYQDQILFQQLNLTIAAAKCTCLLGASGVGKSSLLQLIAGLDNACQQKTGTVSASDHQPLKQRIAYLAQQNMLLPWLTILDNCLIGLHLRQQPMTESIRNRAKQLLQQLGLGDALAKKPASLSGGMRQRVLLVRTLLEDRPIVLMDEPFSALDTITRFRSQQLAAELLQQRTVLLVTHDPLEALRLGHYIYILAGKPAMITQQFIIPGEPPRDLEDPQLWQLQTQLLHSLSQIPEND